ncbi:multicopper oxidase domain-containing protein, partial [Saprospiraceae bacterium]|nr:multicopper oxidase domain-containing protein [Saprospiraceae bacterium]
IPGPTITMIPGNKYVLRFRNTLPYEPLNPIHNILKDPNASNMHTHGLHISGESPGDDVTRAFEGGFGGDFVYDIAADHMGGTHWYHAHHHGSTFLQVACGAFGMLVIDDSGDGIPANVASMAEKQIVLGFLDTSVAGAGGDTLVSGTLSPTWTVNGDVGGTISAQLDTWQHWRVLIADTDAKDKVLSFGPECEVVLLARDGVWRTSAPGVVTNNDIQITGASRADFAVRVSANSQLQIDGLVVASIAADGLPDTSSHPYAPDGVSLWSAVRPSYLRELRNVPASNINLETVSMGASDINNVPFDANVPLFAYTTDKVQEWRLQGAKNHPFHMHIYHVQAQETKDDFEAGEYYDTISENMDVRFDLSTATASPFAGRTIFHCHILEHEDQGAMAWADVTGGTPSPTFPLDGDIPEPYSEYYSVMLPIGDANGDGVFNNADIAPFVLALTNPVAYQAMFPDVDTEIVLDMNGDGGFDNADIAGFVAALTGGKK